MIYGQNFKLLWLNPGISNFRMIHQEKCVAMDSKFLIEADSEDSDQIGQWLI